jgi:membrane-bound metal-dependent hydrolase YbcI (DUF457 family)
MDFLNHLIIGYIISSVASGSLFNDYVVLGTLMAILPDFDFILKPLGRRLPILGHRGITHTFAFILFSSMLIYLLYSYTSGQWDFRLELILLMCGASHILVDFVTYSGVPLFYPWVRGYSKLNLDMSVNPVVLLLVIIFLVALNYINVENISPAGLRRLIYALGAIYLLYFLLRAALKRHYSQKPDNRTFDAIPTWNPFSWRFASRLETPEEIQVIIKRDQGVRVYKIPKLVRELEKIDNCQDLVSTYWHPKVQEYLHLFEFPYYELECQGEEKKIYWRAAEVGDLVRIRVAWKDGKLILRTQGQIILPLSGGRHLYLDFPG